MSDINELCVRMLQYAAMAKHTEDRKSSEIKDALRFFFTDAEINHGIAVITGRKPHEAGDSQ